MDRGGALVGSDLEYDLLDLEIPSSHEYSATPHESYIFTVANRILFSKYYYIVYIVMFVAQTIFFIWGLINHNLFTKVTSDDVWYIVFDVLITLLLAAEVIFRIIATHRTYWRSWLNRVDFIMMLLCVSALLLYAVDPEVAIAGSLLLAVRYAVQICRVIITCKHHRDRTSMLRAMQGEGRIAFDDADDGMTSNSSIVTTQRNNHNGRTTQSGKSGLGSLSSPLMGDEEDMDAALALQNLVPVRSINSRLIRVTDEDREHAQLLSMYEEQAAQREQQQQQQRQKQVAQMNGHTPSPSPSPPLATATTSTSTSATISGPPSPSNRTYDTSEPSRPTLQSQTSIHSFYSQSRVQNDDDEDADGL